MDGVVTGVSPVCLCPGAVLVSLAGGKPSRPGQPSWTEGDAGRLLPGTFPALCSARPEKIRLQSPSSPFVSRDP